MNKTQGDLSQSFIIPGENQLKDQYKSLNPDFFGFQFIPLLKVVINNTETLLMKQSAGRWMGYNIENIRYITETGNLSLKDFISIKESINMILTAGNKDWEDKINALFAEKLPQLNVAIGKLKADILRNFSIDDKSGFITLSPFDTDAFVYYITPDNSFQKRILYVSFFLKLNMNSKNNNFFEFKSLEYIPLKLFKADVDLHPRYSLHTAVSGFFNKYGSADNRDKFSLVNKIPEIRWDMNIKKLFALTFTLDISFYYENSDDMDLILTEFHTPNPGSEEEGILSSLMSLKDERISREEKSEKFISIFDNYVSLSLFKSGMFLRIPGEGLYSGIVEEEVLSGEKDEQKLYPFYVLINLIRFIKNIRIIIDYKQIYTVGPAYDNPEQWFNMRRDIMPFNDTLELKRMDRFFDHTSIPITSGELTLNFRRKGIVVTERAMKFLQIHQFVSSFRGDYHPGLETDELYSISKDDSIVGFIPTSENKTEKIRKLFIWRIK